MRTFFLLIFSLSISLRTAGQEIKVIDKGSGQGIENVYIYDRSFNKAVQTDAEGLVDISGFGDNDTLYFQHSAYQALAVTLPDIVSRAMIVALEEKIIKINEVIISANKWEQNAEKIPNTVTSISSKSIEFSNPATSADLLQQSGQVFVQKSQLGGGSPMIRGFSANSVLIVIDGVRMNNAIFRSGNLQNVINIDVNALEEAEVLFGPGSVMYGSDALGGVMDFHTKKIELKTEKGTGIKLTGFARYSSAANERTGHIDVNIAKRKFGSYTSLSFTGLSDLVTGDMRTNKYPDYGKRTEYVDRINGIDSIVKNENYNKQIQSAYNQYGLIQKFKFRINDYSDINYGFYFSNTTDIPRYDRLIEYDDKNEPVNAEWFYGPQKWMMNSLSARFYRANKLFDEAKYTLAHQHVSESRKDRKYRDAILRERSEKLNLITFSADLDKVIGISSQLFYGVELNFNDVKSTGFEKNIDTGITVPTTTRYPDGGSQYINAAVYGNFQHEINQQNFLNIGARYTFTRLMASIENDIIPEKGASEFTMNNGALNGNLGWVYKPAQNTKVDFVLSSGFRAPNVDDVGKLFDAEPGIVIVPNEGLKPEYSYNIEAGITQKISSDFQVHAVGYYTELIDAMVRRDFTYKGFDSLQYDGDLRKVQSLVNTGRARIYGFSLILKGNISTHWGISATCNITDGKDKIDNVPLRHTPPVFGNFSVYYRKGGFLGELYTQYGGKKPYDRLAPSEQNKPHIYSPDGSLAWYTLNVKVAYSLNRQLSINGGIENILDVHYRTYSSGISAPGRNFLFGLRLNI